MAIQPQLWVKSSLRVSACLPVAKNQCSPNLAGWDGICNPSTGNGTTGRGQLTAVNWKLQTANAYVYVLKAAF